MPLDYKIQIKKILKKIFIRSMILVFIMSCLFSQGCCFTPFYVNDSNDYPGNTGEEIETTVEEPEKHPDADHGIFNGTVNFEKKGNIRVSGQAIDVDIAGNYAYLTNDLGELYIIDIYNKESPDIVGKCPDLDSADIVIVKDGYAYVSYTEYIVDGDDYYTKCGFKIVDISNPDKPEVIGDYNTSEQEKKAVSGLYVDGNFAYLNTHTYEKDHEESSMEIIDVSIKRRPWLVGDIIFDGLPSGTFVMDRFAFVNINLYDRDEEEYTGESKLLVIDITEQDSPKIINSLETPSQAWGIYAEEDCVYITSHKGGEEDDDYRESFLSVIDISDKEKPLILGEVELPGGAWEIDAVDNIVFVSSLDGGLFAVDVSDSRSPFISDRYNTGGTSYDVTLLGNYGYLVDGFEGLEIISLSADEGAGGTLSLYMDEATGNYIPVASIEICGDRASGYYQSGNPVYFSAAGSFDPEGKELTYRWLVNGDLFSDEEYACYFFEDAGINNITLVVSDGEMEDSVSGTVNIAEFNYPVSDIINHNFTLEIEYTLVNNGTVTFTDIECLMRIPQTYRPYQTVNKIDSNAYDIDEVFDNNWNKLLKFVFDEDLPPGREMSAVAIIDMTAGEFDYLPVIDGFDYDSNDDDFLRYTTEDLFIDSENTDIKNTASYLIENEDRPIKIAKILYDFVTRELSYDYDRAGDSNYPFLYASEILKRGSGVCADYAILYTALLRASGVPSRLAAGVPVYTILYEENQEIDMGHAWVEIKLPGLGWVPIDITTEERFWSDNYFLDVITEKGPGYLYENTTMDWTSYYYDGFKFEWDGDYIPDREQRFIFRIDGLKIKDIIKD